MPEHIHKLLSWSFACCVVAAIALPLMLAGCGAGNLIGGMMQNFEYQKKVQVLSQYEGLENATVAVIVNTDMATRYDFPDLPMMVSAGVAARISEHVYGARVIDPRIVYRWQYQTPQWDAMPYGDIVEQLNVDRVVFIDLYEYRLHPPGNRWEWEGVAAANIGIVERDGLVPDMFAEEFSIVAMFPSVKNVSRESASENAIQTGLLSEFIKRTAWLFYDHEEPKYPDKYRPELDR